MKFTQVCLESFGYALPDEVVSSLALERRLAPIYGRFGLHAGRLELMTGIRERRFWAPESVPSDGSTLAGQRAIDASDLKSTDMECLLHTSVSRDFLEPATASVVHQNLSLPSEALMYDISNACLGFLNGMISLANMIELGQVKRGLIVAGESSRPLVDSTIAHLLDNPNLSRRQLKDAFASLTIGSGAVALVMAHDSVSRTGHRLLGGVVRTSTQNNDLCRGSKDTGFADDTTMLMSTDSETLLVSGCELAGQTWKLFKQHLDWKGDSLARCYTHQVGVAHRERLYETIQRDVAQDFTTLEFLGNVGSVSLPVTMAMGIEKASPAKGDHIALLGIGSGLCCMMLGVEW